MDADTRALFEGRLLELAKARLREGRLDPPASSAQSKNPFCGDEIDVDIALNGADLTAVGYEARACSLCVASAELLSAWVDEAPRGTDDISALAHAIRETLKGENAPAGFEALASVAPFRARHKCVTLPFEAALKAIEEEKT